MAYTISHSSDPGLVMLTCSKAFTPSSSLHWIRIDQRQPNSTLLYISNKNPSKTVWWNSSQKELLKPNSIAARYLSCGDNVGVPRDAPQEPLQATKAAAAWAKNTSTGKRVKATFSSKCESPATVVVEPASPLLQTLLCEVSGLSLRRQPGFAEELWRPLSCPDLWFLHSKCERRPQSPSSGERSWSR